MTLPSYPAPEIGEAVSRQHAELHRNPDGSYELTDLGSHGGTFVNGERITRTLLTEQDTISIGHAVFRLSAGELRQHADESPFRTAHEVVAAYWAAAEARDWEAFWPDPYDLPATRAHLVERY